MRFFLKRCLKSSWQKVAKIVDITMANFALLLVAVSVVWASSLAKGLFEYKDLLLTFFSRIFPVFYDTCSIHLRDYAHTSFNFNRMISAIPMHEN